MCSHARNILSYNNHVVLMELGCLGISRYSEVNVNEYITSKNCNTCHIPQDLLYLNYNAIFYYNFSIMLHQN